MSFHHGGTGTGTGASFKHETRERLLDMLTATGNSKSNWKILIMDKVTVKVMSCSCKMADITEKGVSLVEDLSRRRQPLRSMEAIYFIQPSRENVSMLLSDLSGSEPLYKKAYIFFSSPIQKELVNLIRDDSVRSRVGALKEMNLEYFAVDSQGFVTNNERALEELFGDYMEKSCHYDACLNVMATRIATVFASLREFPFVRYRAAKSLDPLIVTTFADLIPTKLACSVWNCLTKYKATRIDEFPQKETCELLIVDRSVDPIAPVIHEWTYDAMCHDLLNMEGNKYTQEFQTGCPPQKKEVLLEDHDPVWLELRHTHIADASERLHDKMTNFVSKNKAAQSQHGSRNGRELSTRDLQKMVQDLPQYSEQIDKLSLHVEIAGKINKIVRDLGLRELGQLEQDLVFGDAGTREIIKYLKTNENATPENKLRLLMIYSAIYPEKFKGDRGLKLMQLARISPEDMTAAHNMRLLNGGPADTKKSSTGNFSLKFDIQKKDHGVRKDRNGDEEMWQLSRFYPMIEVLIEKLSKGELPISEYPCMNDPIAAVHDTSERAPVQSNHVPTARSMRSKRSATWARPRNSDDGYSSDSILRHTNSDSKRMGRRIFIFIIGGATRSELRICHKLTTKLKREIILGSSSLDDPPQFITKMKLLNADGLALDDLQI